MDHYKKALDSIDRADAQLKESERVLEQSVRDHEEVDVFAKRIGTACIVLGFSFTGTVAVWRGGPLGLVFFCAVVTTLIPVVTLIQIWRGKPF